MASGGFQARMYHTKTRTAVRTAGGPEAWLHQRPKLSQKPVVSHRVEEGGGPFLLIPASRAPSLFTVPQPPGLGCLDLRKKTHGTYPCL